MRPIVQLTIPADAEYLELVRLTLYGVAVKLGFQYEQIEDMKVAVGEACNNAIVHGYRGGNHSGSVHLQFEQEDGGLTIRIKDEGASFNFEQAVHQSTSLHKTKLSEAAIGGLGLYMMQALMDNVEIVTNRGTEVILTKLLSRKEEMA